MIVSLIGGPADGMRCEYFTIPKRIIMPCLPYFSMWNKFREREELVISQAIYERIGDTLEFVCISEPKGKENG